MTLPRIEDIGLTQAQRDGHACSCCGQPSPPNPIAQLPGGQTVYLCDDCDEGCDEKD